jgi:hypothetical protein
MCDHNNIQEVRAMRKTYKTMLQILTLKSEGLSNTAIANSLGLHLQIVFITETMKNPPYIMTLLSW